MFGALYNRVGFCKVCRGFVLFVGALYSLLGLPPLLPPPPGPGPTAAAGNSISSTNNQYHTIKNSIVSRQRGIGNKQWGIVNIHTIKNSIHTNSISSTDNTNVTNSNYTTYVYSCCFLLFGVFVFNS